MNYNGEYKALFADDAGKGVILECENCEKQFYDEEEFGEQLYCPHCKVSLRYPEGASW